MTETIRYEDFCYFCTFARGGEQILVNDIGAISVNISEECFNGTNAGDWWAQLEGMTHNGGCHACDIVYRCNPQVSLHVVTNRPNGCIGTNFIESEFARFV